MAIVVKASGTQVATPGTEHVLTTQTDDESYVLVVDADEIVAGEELELKVKTKVLSGTTLEEAYEGSWDGPTAQPIKISIPVPSDIEFVATLKQIGGSSRSFPWKVLAI
ncbi:MAG: hypothetical protein V3V01_10755 [Acidimicrobiales bacterium]